jgi:hypothetical protein
MSRGSKINVNSLEDDKLCLEQQRDFIPISLSRAENRENGYWRDLPDAGLVSWDGGHGLAASSILCAATSIRLPEAQCSQDDFTGLIASWKPR